MSPAPALSQLLAPCPLRWHQGISLRIASTLPIPSLPAVGPSIHSFVHRIHPSNRIRTRDHASCAQSVMCDPQRATRTTPIAPARELGRPPPSVVGKPHRSSSTSSSSPSRAPYSPTPYSLPTSDIRHPTSSSFHLPPSTFDFHPHIHLHLHLIAPILQHRPFDRPPRRERRPARTRLVRAVHHSSLARHSSCNLSSGAAHTHSGTRIPPRAHSSIGALR